MKNTNESSNIFIIGTISILLGFAYFFGSDMFVPSLPEITSYFATDSGTSRLTISMFLLSLSLSQLIYGPASDKFGRKPIILTGIFIFILGSTICLISPSINLLLAGRIVEGLGVGALITLSKTIVQDSTTQDQFVKIVSILSIFFLIAPACAPFVGGILTTYFGWRSNFVFMLIFGILIFFIMTMFFKETLETKNHKALSFSHLYANYVSIIKNIDFLILSYVIVVALSGLVVFYTIGPFLLSEKFHVSAMTFGIFSVIIMSGALLSRIISSTILMRHYSLEFILLLGLILMFVGSVILMISAVLNFSSLFLIVSSMSVFAVGGVLVAPIATTTALGLFSNIAGAAGAMYGFLQMGGLFISSYSAAIVPASELSLAVILFILAASVLVIYYIRHKIKISSN
jgi:DHA1 family 2-module integral membrane pump EmrD-like MFS transporter